MLWVSSRSNGNFSDSRESPGVVTPAQLAKSFQRARVDRIEELLQTLVLLGQARQVEEGKYAA